MEKEEGNSKIFQSNLTIPAVRPELVEGKICYGYPIILCLCEININNFKYKYSVIKKE